MNLRWSSKFDLIRLILGSCSGLNVAYLLYFGADFFQTTGPYPAHLAVDLRSPNLLQWLPVQIIDFLPYWNRHILTFSSSIHFLILACFIFEVKSKITTPLLFLFEYLLLIRTGSMIHGGHLLFLTSLLILSFKDVFHKPHLSSSTWVIQFCLVYLFSGLYKDIDQWFIQGSALQRFVDLDYANQGKSVLDLGYLGEIASRLIIPLELLIPSYILVAFFFPRFYKRSLLMLSVAILMLIHLASFRLFTLFTFPFIGIAFVAGIYRGVITSWFVPMKTKLIIFLIIFPLHLLPALNTELLLTRVIPLRNKWTLFSKPPGVVGGKIIVKVVKSGKSIYQTDFSESFHWGRYRFILDESFNRKDEVRWAFNNYLCRKYEADSIHWNFPKRSDLQATLEGREISCTSLN